MPLCAWQLEAVDRGITIDRLLGGAAIHCTLVRVGCTGCTHGVV